jgi:hypothetical protein
MDLSRFLPRRLYNDEDAAPVLGTQRFAVFREAYPKPADAQGAEPTR